jgi:hypothetical protein
VIDVGESVRWRARPRVVHASLENGCVLLDLDSCIYVTLNTSALGIWERLLERPQSVAELAIWLASEYEVERTDAARDVAELIDGLARDGLVER